MTDRNVFKKGSVENRGSNSTCIQFIIYDCHQSPLLEKDL